MKLAWENQHAGSVIEPGITCLAWHGDLAHGQLAVGSESGVVGITFTDLEPIPPGDYGRFNFNLRGHHTGVTSVAWNSTQGKLASSDQAGVIYVWSRNEERWSVELVNERGVKVRDVSWSPCGAAALFCYEDNFVLIGSAAGQRIWSSNFPPMMSVVCGVWVSARLLVLALSTGHIQLISDDGSHLADRFLCQDPIRKLISPPGSNRFAALTQTGSVYILREFDQHEPSTFAHEDIDICVFEWDPNGEHLCAISSQGEIYILNDYAELIHRDRVYLDANQKVTAMTWAHGGNSLIVAAGGSVHVARVFPGVPSLYSLVAYQVWRSLKGGTKKISSLDLPATEKEAIRAFDHHVIRCRIPSLDGLKEFTCKSSEFRCHCTIRPGPSKGKTYVLCVEHMGGLVPLLVGRQVSRLVPQFHISLHPGNAVTSAYQQQGNSAQVEDLMRGLSLARSPPQRQSLWRRSKRHFRTVVLKRVSSVCDVKMAQVTSNVCCTKFQVTGMTEGVPTFLAQVSYKTSVLHLQPRQMTVKMRKSEEMLRADAAKHALLAVDKETDVKQSRSSSGRGSAKEGEKGIGKRRVTESLPSSSVAATSTATAALVAPTTSSARSRFALRRIDPDAPSTSSTWEEELLESMEFIDEEESDTEALLGKQFITQGMREQLLVLTEVALLLEQRHEEVKQREKDEKVSISEVATELKELNRRVDCLIKADPGKVQPDLNEIQQKIQKMKEEITAIRKVKEKEAAGKKRKGEDPLLFQVHNKAPFWNEHNQVYQLDFGGRVTQESAKNFQIDIDGVGQALQFGRIEGGAYTLDYRTPFTAIQAFAIALASITQRLK